MRRKVAPAAMRRKARRRRKHSGLWRQWSDSLGRPGFGRARGKRRGWLRWVRRAFAVGIVSLAVVLWLLPELVRTPDLLTQRPLTVDADWTFCGRGASRYCVVDGDTLRIGEARVRLMGFDTPETGPRAACPAEAARAEDAKRALLRWANEGPVTFRARYDNPADRWGRPLREVYRETGGRREYVGDVLVKRGLARRYYGGEREGWC